MASWGSVRRAALAAVAASCLGATVLVACDVPGITIIVNTTSDGPDANPGDGVCEVTPGAGDCTVRATVMESNAHEPTPMNVNDIELGDGHTYVLTIPGAGEDGAATGDLDVTAGVTINGHSTIDGGNLDRVLDVFGGVFRLNDATIRNGRAITTDTATSIGGGVRIASGLQADFRGVTFTDDTAFEGGAVYSSGQTRFFGSTIMNSQAIGRVRDDGVILFAHGGAIRTNGGYLSTFQTTITNNGLVTAGDGAAIAAQSEMVIEKSTVSGNLATLPGAFASAVTVLPSSGRVLLLESTVSNNAGPAVVSTAASGGTSAGLVIDSSTLADNSGPVIGTLSTVTLGAAGIQTSSTACQSIPVSQGYNVVSDATCALTGTGDIQNLSPLVGPVADNTGPTLTNLPFKNSPMLHIIPFGTPILCDANGPTDQRGVARPTAGFCNSGAVEGNSPKNGITVNPPA